MTHDQNSLEHLKDMTHDLGSFEHLKDQEFPVEIWVYDILIHLPFQDVKRWMLTSKTAHSLLKDNEMFWKKYLQFHVPSRSKYHAMPNKTYKERVLAYHLDPVTAFVRKHLALKEVENMSLVYFALDTKNIDLDLVPREERESLDYPCLCQEYVFVVNKDDYVLVESDPITLSDKMTFIEMFWKDLRHSYNLRIDDSYFYPLGDTLMCQRLFWNEGIIALMSYGFFTEFKTLPLHQYPNVRHHPDSDFVHYVCHWEDIEDLQATCDHFNDIEYDLIRLS
jgi:hypothetical protein